MSSLNTNTRRANVTSVTRSDKTNLGPKKHMCLIMAGMIGGASAATEKAPQFSTRLGKAILPAGYQVAPFSSPTRRFEGLVFNAHGVKEGFIHPDEENNFFFSRAMPNWGEHEEDIGIFRDYALQELRNDRKNTKNLYAFPEKDNLFTDAGVAGLKEKLEQEIRVMAKQNLELANGREIDISEIHVRTEMIKTRSKAVKWHTDINKHSCQYLGFLFLEEHGDNYFSYSTATSTEPVPTVWPSHPDRASIVVPARSLNESGSRTKRLDDMERMRDDQNPGWTDQGNQVLIPIAQYGDFRMWTKNLQHFAHKPMGDNVANTRSALIYSIWWLKPEDTLSRTRRRLVDGEKGRCSDQACTEKEYKDEFVNC